MTTQKKVLSSKTDVKVSFNGKNFPLHNLGLKSINSLGNIISALFGGIGGIMNADEKESANASIGFVTQFFSKLNPEDIAAVVSDALKITEEEVMSGWTNKEGISILSKILAQEDVQEIFLDLAKGIAPNQEMSKKA